MIKVPYRKIGALNSVAAQPNPQMQLTGRRGAELRAGGTFRWCGCGNV